MVMVEECDCAHEQAGQRRLDSLRPTGASTCVVRVQGLSLVAVRNNPSPSHPSIRAEAAVLKGRAKTYHRHEAPGGLCRVVRGAIHVAGKPHTVGTQGSIHRTRSANADPQKGASA